MKKLYSKPLIALALLLPSLAIAQGDISVAASDIGSASERGLEIALEADRRDLGWQDQSANMTMVLRNRTGQESTRAMRLKSLEVEGDGDQSLTIFDEPRDVEGTAFLSYTHALIADEQWLYLPALKRVKRISSSNKSGPFMGSEFAYEDISSQEVEKYTYKWLRDQMLDGRNAFVVERIPQYEHSGYTKQIVWMDEEMYQPVKVEFYDRRGSLLKTLVADQFQQYLGQYWRTGRMHMVNHLTGKETTLTWTDYEFQTDLSERDFDQSSLQRAR